jgi:hypothetical protein
MEIGAHNLPEEAGPLRPIVLRLLGVVEEKARLLERVHPYRRSPRPVYTHCCSSTKLARRTTPGSVDGDTHDHLLLICPQYSAAGHREPARKGTQRACSQLPSRGK